MTSPGVITFEDLANTQAFAAVPLPYLRQGFSLTTTDPMGIVAVGTKSVQYLGTTGLVAIFEATIKLSRTDGKPFSLLGIDLSPFDNDHPGIVYSFAGQKADGSTISQDISLLNQNRGFRPYALAPAFDDLLFVTWTMNAEDSGQYFDNIRYSLCSAGG